MFMLTARNMTARLQAEANRCLENQVEQLIPPRRLHSQSNSVLVNLQGTTTLSQVWCPSIYHAQHGSHAHDTCTCHRSPCLITVPLPQMQIVASLSLFVPLIPQLTEQSYQCVPKICRSRVAFCPPRPWHNPGIYIWHVKLGAQPIF